MKKDNKTSEGSCVNYPYIKSIYSKKVSDCENENCNYTIEIYPYHWYDWPGNLTIMAYVTYADPLKTVFYLDPSQIVNMPDLSAGDLYTYYAY